MQAKFTDFTPLNEEQAHEYGRVYMLEKYPTYSRLKIGASSGAIELLMRLSDSLELPFYCLYVLVDRPHGNAGRAVPIATTRKQAGTA